MTSICSFRLEALKACSHRAFVFAIFCTIQCRKRFHLSLMSMGDANARYKQALKVGSHSRFLHVFVLRQFSCNPHFLAKKSL